MNDSKKAAIALGMNTLAFTVCFASWMAYSILIAHLVKTGEFQWTAGQIGALIAVPILTGSLMRLPIGILTDLFGGRVVYTLLMLVSAIPMYATKPHARQVFVHLGHRRISLSHAENRKVHLQKTISRRVLAIALRN